MNRFKFDFPVEL